VEQPIGFLSSALAFDRTKRPYSSQPASGVFGSTERTGQQTSVFQSDRDDRRDHSSTLPMALPPSGTRLHRSTLRARHRRLGAGHWAPNESSRRLTNRAARPQIHLPKYFLKHFLEFFLTSIVFRHRTNSIWLHTGDSLAQAVSERVSRRGDSASRQSGCICGFVRLARLFADDQWIHYFWQNPRFLPARCRAGTSVWRCTIGAAQETDTWVAAMITTAVRNLSDRLQDRQCSCR
jgi:hypothetical protein